MRGGVGVALGGAFVLIACATAGRAQAGADPAPTPASDPVAKLQLLGAAFAEDQARPTTDHATAMAFLPGRGVVAWDVTGKTAEQAKEAEVEAMGLADARAVQREIDEAAAQKAAQAEAERAGRLALAGDAHTRHVGLSMPVITGTEREAGAVALLNRPAKSGNLLGVKSAETVKGKPRLYAFAAVSGRSVGLNVLHDDAGWKNGGLTTDRDGFTGQRQAGLAWRKGVVQTSLSYVQQKDKVQILGMQSEKDQRVMLNVALPPQAIFGLFAKKD